VGVHALVPAPRAEEEGVGGLELLGEADLGGELAMNYLEKLSNEDADKLLEMIIIAGKKIEAGAHASDEILEIAREGARKLGLISMMRKAFAGLLIGDIILSQLGKNLGIKEKLSITDFIILTGAQVFEKEGLKELDREKLRKALRIMEEAQNK